MKKPIEILCDSYNKLSKDKAYSLMTVEQAGVQGEPSALLIAQHEKGTDALADGVEAELVAMEDGDHVAVNFGEDFYYETNAAVALAWKDYGKRFAIGSIVDGQPEPNKQNFMGYNRIDDQWTEIIPGDYTAEEVLTRIVEVAYRTCDRELSGSVINPMDENSKPIDYDFGKMIDLGDDNKAGIILDVKALDRRAMYLTIVRRNRGRFYLAIKEYEENRGPVSRLLDKVIVDLAKYWQSLISD